MEIDWLTLTLDVFKYDNKEIKEVLEQGLILDVFKYILKYIKFIFILININIGCI